MHRAKRCFNLCFLSLHLSLTHIHYSLNLLSHNLPRHVSHYHFACAGASACTDWQFFNLSWAWASSYPSLLDGTLCHSWNLSPCLCISGLWLSHDTRPRWLLLLNPILPCSPFECCLRKHPLISPSWWVYPEMLVHWISTFEGRSQAGLESCCLAVNVVKSSSCSRSNRICTQVIWRDFRQQKWHLL